MPLHFREISLRPWFRIIIYKAIDMPQQPPVVLVPASTPLRRALGQNEAVQDTVEQSAADLLVINTVLKQEIPEHVQTGDVAQALQKTDELETRIQESADDLAQVNETLEQEIDERADLERELARTKAALAKATGQPHAK
jgi:C4-dicarboxylate-specific signal transduction histidine kinase